ncbi:MAG: hypothetical protein Q9219_001705 [cf. Caloplaca sp. 3 TL-2023]
MALLNDIVGPEHIGRAVGYTSTALTIGLLIGPALGGVLYEYAGYFPVFLPALGLMAVELVLRLMVVEPEASRRSSAKNSLVRPPQNSSSTEQVSEESDIKPNSRRGSQSKRQSETEPLLHNNTVSKNAFFTLLSCPRFIVAMLGLFILNGIGCSFDGVLTPYIHDTFQMKATYAAALFLILALPMFIAPLSGALADRYGAKWPAAVGFAVSIPSLMLLTTVAAGTAKPFLKLVILLSGVGIGMSLASTPLRAEASKVVDVFERDTPGVFGPQGAYSQAYGLTLAAIAAGGFTGPLGAGFVRVNLGWATVFWSLGIFSAVMAVLVVALSGGEGSAQKAMRKEREDRVLEGSSC